MPLKGGGIMAKAEVAGISFELSFDGSKMLTSINSSCKKVKEQFTKSFSEAAKESVKAIETGNEEIDKILKDTERSAKSKAASIASIYKKEGLSQSEAFKKAWSLVGKESDSGSKKVKKNLKGIGDQSKKTASEMGSSLTKGFTSIKKIAMAMAAAFSIRKLVDFGKSCLELGSDLAEVQNVVDVTFPSMTAQVDKFAQGAAKSFGLSETMAKQYTGTFGAMAKAFGFTEKQAYDMGTTLTGLAGDVASFYNISQDEAYTKLKSVFTGETESLKDLGVVMTQTALDAYAMANGFGKTTSQMSEAEKVALRYAFVQDQLTAATGDFARTSDSWANQCRIMTLQIDSLKASIGQGLINLFTPVLRVINAVIERLAVLASTFKSFTELITGKKSSTQQIADAGNAASAGMNNAAESADNATKSTNKTASAAKKAAKEMRSLMGFDKINKLDSKTDSSSESSNSNAVPPTNFGSLEAGKNSLDKVNDSAKKLADSFQKIWKPFEDAWKAEGKRTIAAAEFALNNIKKLGKDVAKSIATVWTNGTGTKMLTTILQIAQNILTIIGNIAGQLDKAWNKNSVGTGIIQAIANIYQAILDFINKITKATAEWAEKLDFYPLLNSIKNLLEAVSPLFEKIGNYLDFLYEKIVLPFLKWVIESALPTIINLAAGFLGLLGKFQPVIDVIGSGLIGAFAATKIVSLIGTISAVISGLIALFTGPAGLMGGLSAMVAALGGPVTIALTAIIATGILLYKNWDTIKEKCTQLKNWVVEKVTGLRDSVVEAFNTLREKTVSSMKTLASNVKGKWQSIKDNFSQFSNWLGSKFASAWTLAFKGLKSTAEGFRDKLKNVFRDGKGYFNEILRFMNEKFLSKWKKAWKDTRDTFSNVFNALGSLAKKPLNAIISAFNSVIRTINSLITKINSIKFTIDIPDWIPGFGGSSWGFNGFSIPKMSYVPALAQGAYVKPNTPQLAMIGDNMHQGEFVAPEDKLKQAVREATGDNSQAIALLMKIIELLEDMPIVGIDPEALRKYFIQKTNQNTKARGKSELVY